MGCVFVSAGVLLIEPRGPGSSATTAPPLRHHCAAIVAASHEDNLQIIFHTASAGAWLRLAAAGGVIINCAAVALTPPHTKSLVSRQQCQSPKYNLILI